jgi:hypothetical protein
LPAAQLLGRKREVVVIGIRCFLPPSRKSIPNGNCTDT